MKRVFNFSPGPAMLPEPVLRKAQEELLDWQGSGMSVMEVSHRGTDFIEFAASITASDITNGAASRSAISRAYYGAYHSVRILIDDGLNIDCRAGNRDLSEHAVVQRYMMHCQVEVRTRLMAKRASAQCIE